MSNTPPPSLLELICTKKWQKARDAIEADAESLYAVCGNNNRLVIHELCKLASFPSSPESSGEISDDEDDETSDARTKGCLDCVKEDSRNICEFVKFMVDRSHTLGPIKVAFPPLETNVEEEGCRSEVHESVLTVTDSQGKTPLHVLCENSVDTNVLKVILGCTREHNQNPCAPTAISLIISKDSRGSTPLHYLAYSRQCPLSSLEVMMDYCKPSAEQTTAAIDPTMTTDVDGDTPLHWALDGYMSPRRIKQLIRHSNKALRVTNLSGKRPFDQFVGNFVDSDWKLHELCGTEIWDNIQAYLKVVADEEQNKEEWLPVHMLAGSSIDFPSVFIDIALHFNKEDLSKPDAKGMLPLHLACARKSPNKAVPCDDSLAFRSLGLYPQAAYKASGNTKRLAIHLAVESQKPLPVIAALLKAYPNSLNVKDPITGLWPFLLAAIDNDETIDVSYSLLRADPSIVQLAIRALISKRGQRAAQALRKMDPGELEEQSSRRMRRLVLREDNM